MTPSVTDSAVKAAIRAIASESATTQEKIEMLLEMAQNFQKKPKTIQDLQNSLELYNHAYQLCGENYPLVKARVQVGMAGVLRTIPDTGTELLLQAKAYYDEALPVLQQLASDEEVAEAKMNLGLVLQSLVPFNLARIAESLQAYQEALQVFTWQKYPQEYAILQNNIAIAYLSMPLASAPEGLHQGLAVQTFEEALKHIQLIAHPKEYAMLQNNLGNALQYLPTRHPLDNLLRAIAAYDEALKVRNARDTPLEYANTISNKANALFNLPNNPETPDAGKSQNLLQVRTYYQSALEIFNHYEQIEQAQVITQALQEVDAEINNEEKS